jgi:hypothetical protein
MPSGVPNGIGDHHAGASTDMTGILSTIPGGVGAVLDTWASVSGFSNLGQVADSGGRPGTWAGQPGDIRVGAYPFDGQFGALMHAYRPGVASMFTNGSIGGDVHFDNAELWVDDPLDTLFDPDFDTFTVLLHELGHALGLGHSDVPGSVMNPAYTGARRSLHEDDIARIQALYGPPTDVSGAPVPTPEPVSLAIWSVLGASGLLARCRRRRIV